MKMLLMKYNNSLSPSQSSSKVKVEIEKRRPTLTAQMVAGGRNGLGWCSDHLEFILDGLGSGAIISGVL